MMLHETLAPIVTAALMVAVVVVVCLSYVCFTAGRRLSAAVAGGAGGLTVGTLLGVGAPVVVGGLAGGLAGFVLADRHPRGGTVAVAAGAGLSIGPLAVLAVSADAAAAVTIGVGAVLALALSALGWRYPRTVILPGLSGAIGAGIAVGGVAVGPSVAALAGGSLLGAVPIETEAAPFLVLGPVLFGTFGITIQPFAVEYTSRVPPLLPARLRGWFGADDAGQGVPEGILPPCPDCGTIRDPGHGVCPSCDVQTDTAYAVPESVEAVSVTCPSCGERPVQGTANARHLTGLLIAYRVHREEVIGCHACVRDACFGAARRTAVTGWWSISCIIMNPFVIVANLSGGLRRPGPTRSLLGKLEDAGADYDLLEDAEEFDPEEHSAETRAVDGLVRLGAAVMLATGGPDREAARRIRDVVLETTDRHDRAAIEEKIERAARDDPDVDRAVEALEDWLTPDGRRMAMDLVEAVVDAQEGADGEEILATIRERLDPPIDWSEVTV